MLDGTDKVKVTNISSGFVVYKIPELNVRKEFIKGASKNITVEELRALQFTPGGQALMRDFLSVDSDELLREFGIIAEPEYKWTEADVKDMLLNGSLARLQDCLDYAPKGIVNLVKALAVSLQINDMSKRQAILEKTGFNVTNAINLDTIAKADETAAPETKPGRRVLEEQAVPKVETHYVVTK